MNEKTTARAGPARKPEKGKFFVFGPDLHGGQHEIEIVNKGELIWPGDLTWFPPGRYPDRQPYPVIPRLAFKKEARKNKLPRDLDAVGGIWVASERMKRIFESVDPEGFAFAACDFTMPDGSNGPQLYLCDVVRTLDALDEEASDVRIIIDRDYKTGEEVKIYSVTGGASLAFKPEAVGNVRVFVQWQLGADPICDHVLRDACREAGLGRKDGLKGIRFRDAADF
jgi:hypothetical protein